MPPELSNDHVAAICRVLIEHDVRFVIIGGMAGRLHHTGHVTVDVDICPSTDVANLDRLAAALAGLGARLRVSRDPDGVPFEPHTDMLRQVELMTLITEHGPLDLCLPRTDSPTASQASVSTPLSSRSRPLRCRWPRSRMSSHQNGRQDGPRTSLRCRRSKHA